jgi:hypothetical protein
VNEVEKIEPQQPVGEVQPEAKVMQQHEINALVGGAKQKGYEKGEKEGYQRAKAELMQQSQASIPTPQTQSFNPTDNDTRLRQIAIEELSKQRAEEQAKWEAQQREEAGMRILNDLQAKSSSAKNKFDDYEKVVRSDFKSFERTPEVLLLANQFDNPGEMLYDMAKNPGKIAQIALMERMGMKEEAYAEMKRLSDSIKVNEMSANQPKPKMPLSQVSPSTVGVGKTDSKVSSSDFKGMY